MVIIQRWSSITDDNKAEDGAQVAKDREATQEEGVKHASNAQLSTTKSVTVTNTSIVYVTHTGK